jgi:hypothetical protein
MPVLMFFRPDFALTGPGRFVANKAISSFCDMDMPSSGFTRQQFLYFFPLPQGHGSLRPVFNVWLSVGAND